MPMSPSLIAIARIRNMARKTAVAASLLLLAWCVPHCHAWLRPVYEDVTVVERSELIVVARLKQGSIQHVEHERKGDEGRSWEHHATLVITQVLNGKCDKTEIPIIIHYGLTPIVGDAKQAPKGAIEIHDTGNSAAGGPPLLKDANQDHLWFLRKRSGRFGREPGTGNFGIVDPEDVQPLPWKDYFLCYLSENPEKAIRAYIAKNADKAKRAKNYLEHLDVQRILQMDDPAQRFGALLPFFLNRTTWKMKPEARHGIVGCGKHAGAKLTEMFGDPNHKRLRHEIITMWRDMGYRESVPLLLDLLKQHDQFWAKQDLRAGWWNDFSNDELTNRRRDIYGEVYAAVYTLRSFRDPRAREALELTRKRWAAIHFDNRQIVEECEVALKELGGTRD
jgi:hypothetical protein